MYQNQKPFALTNCILLDGTEHMEPQSGKAVCIDGGRIREIADAGGDRLETLRLHA